MLEWLENSSIALMVQESLWGYPIVLSSHAIGMAVMVGLALMINFRVLGLAPQIPISSLKTLFRFAWVGLAINMISGSMLFVANADAFYESTPFRLKIILLIIGVTMLARLSRQLFGPAAVGADYVPDSRTRWMALLSSLVWIGVIVTGRLIAYWDWKEF